MKLDEARELARAMIVEGAEHGRIKELERYIDELDGQVRRLPRGGRARHYRYVKLMRRDLKVDEDKLRRLVSAAWLLWRQNLHLPPKLRVLIDYLSETLASR